MVIAKNAYLTLEEMTINANYIHDYLISRGWSKNAITGMLGNMQTESTINPGIWQSLISYDHDPYILVESHGYGLVQWTPFNKYTIWARDNDLDYSHIDSQLLRIEYELQNGIQWISTSDYPLSFQDFKIFTASPLYLAQVFLRNYERPANLDQPNRSTHARYWWDVLLDVGTIDLPHPPDNRDIVEIKQYISMLLCDAVNGWKF